MCHPPAMSLPPPPHESFKIRLRGAIEAAGISVYALARKLDPANPETAERNLRRWLSPTSTHLPSPASAKALSEALGVTPDFFDPQPGAMEMAELARARAAVAFREEIIRRRVWCPPGGPFGGYYLAPDERKRFSS